MEKQPEDMTMSLKRKWWWVIPSVVFLMVRKSCTNLLHRKSDSEEILLKLVKNHSDLRLAKALKETASQGQQIQIKLGFQELIKQIFWRASS